MARCVVAIAASALAVGGAVAGHAATTKPSLLLVKAAPLTVRGLNFQPHERTRVVASGFGARMIRASTAGTFVAAFPETILDRCSGGFTIVAIGGRGSSARLKLPALDCPPSLGP